MVHRIFLGMERIKPKIRTRCRAEENRFAQKRHVETLIAYDGTEITIE